MPERPAPYQAAVVQFGIYVVFRNGHFLEDMSANARRMVRWIEFICETSIVAPRLFVFPVLSLVGAARRTPFTTDMPIQLTGHPIEPALEPLVTACAKYDCYIATSTVERHPAFPGHLFHSGFVLSKDGVILRQPKVQARSSASVTVLNSFRAEYANALGESEVQTVVETPIGSIGCIIEVEQFVPEVTRTLMKRGAEVVVHPNLEHAGRTLPFTATKETLAFQNGIYLLSANIAYERWQDADGPHLLQHRGQSLIAGPDGSVRARCDYVNEGFALATIDLAHLDAMREQHRDITQPSWSLYSGTYQDA